MRTSTTGAVASVLLTGALLVSGCGADVDPCADLARPSQQEINDANQGKDVDEEVRVGGEWVECEWDGNGWQEEEEG